MYEFKGWNWTELGEAWGITQEAIDDNESEAIIMAYLSKIASNAMGSKKGSEYKEALKLVAEDIKSFLVALSQYKTYERPLWQGMLDIEDDYTLVKFTIRLLTDMWT